MKTYQVKINSIQRWVYVMEVTADNEADAKQLGLDAYVSGEEGVDNWLDTDESHAGNATEKQNGNA